MSEPSLSCKINAAESYRFLWLRTWGAPVAVRVDLIGDVATLSAVALDGEGGYEPGVVVKRVERKLSREEWKAITTGLDSIAFWNLPARIHDVGLDGAEWILEGRRGTRYHVVDRWSPDQGAYRDFCLSLLSAAGMVPTGEGGKAGIY